MTIAAGAMSHRFLNRIDDISAESWDSLSTDNYPFVRHGFLSALEQSGSVGRDKGWQPQHLVVEVDDQLVAAVPLYIKWHSYGEYVFDWAWASAYQRQGLDYYPKLVTAIPFTPCTGSRFLIAPQYGEALLPTIVRWIQARAHALGASGWHCLFPTVAQSEQLRASGAAQRLGCQFHWYNRGYHSWEDFLAGLQSRKRKGLSKERRAVAERGIHFVKKVGAELQPEDWQLFYQLYCNTYLKRSGHSGYLTEAFFPLLAARCADQLLMVQAHKNGQAIAAALYFTDDQTLYGRYWGCLEEYGFLHFETCYYQGIDYAIAQGLARFDGGAQGEHKIQRGFEPQFTYSNHWLVQPAFQRAIERFLQEEALSISAYRDEASEYLPFKCDGS